MEQYRTICHRADNGGCGFYRMVYPVLAAHTLKRNIQVIESTKLIPLPEFYSDVRMVRIQRQLSDIQCKFILNFLKPLSERYGFWLCYEIDDVCGRHDIPKYNPGWHVFQNDQLMENMKQILNVCDIITVTTDELAHYYHTKFSVPMDKFYIIPNYLPRWWIGDSYSEDAISIKYDKMQKPKIGFASSSTHYDIVNNNNGIDDFSHINNFIRNTVDEYEWIFIGGVPQQLKDLYKDNKITYHSGFDILNYPHSISKMGLHAVVAPLQDNIFNRCKSNIKFLEMSALGIPCIVQDLAPYIKYTDLRFKNENDLSVQLDSILKNKTNYMENVKLNRAIIENGDKYSPKGWWLENNMDKWFNLFCINQKTMRFDLTKLDNKSVEDNKLVPSKQVPQITFEV